MALHVPYVLYTVDTFHTVVIIADPGHERAVLSNTDQVGDFDDKRERASGRFSCFGYSEKGLGASQLAIFGSQNWSNHFLKAENDLKNESSEAGGKNVFGEMENKPDIRI